MIKTTDFNAKTSTKKKDCSVLHDKEEKYDDGKEKEEEGGRESLPKVLKAYFQEGTGQG